MLEQNYQEIDNFVYNLETKINNLISTQELINAQYDAQSEVSLINFYAKNYQGLDEIVAKDEFEKKLLNDQIPCELIDYKSISEELYKLSSQVMLIEPKFDKKQQNPAQTNTEPQLNDRQGSAGTQSKQQRQNPDQTKQQNARDQMKYQFLSTKLKENYDKVTPCTALLLPSALV